MKLVLVTWVFLLVACTQNNSPNEVQVSRESPKIKVTTTVNMVSDLVRQIGAGHVEVVEIMGPGVDPHLYKASANDVIKLQEADVIFYVGLLLEGKMEEVLGKLKDGGKPVYAVTENIDADRLLKPDEFEGHFDPHIWFEVLLWKETIDAVVSSLGKLDPANKVDYEANGRTAKAKMDELQQWAEAKVTEIPPQKRILVTSHDAYNYFARAYGFEVKGLQGISTETKPGLQNIRAAVKYIRENSISVIFAETSVPRDAVEKVAQEAGCEIFEHELYSDALGKPGSQAESFLGMFRFNLETILTALGGGKGEDQ